VLSTPIFGNYISAWAVRSRTFCWRRPRAVIRQASRFFPGVSVPLRPSLSQGWLRASIFHRANGQAVSSTRPFPTAIRIVSHSIRKSLFPLISWRPWGGPLQNTRMSDSLFLEQSDRKQLIDIVAASSGFVADPDVQRGIQPWVRATMEDLQKFRDGSYVGPGGPFKPGTLEQYKSLMLSGPLFGVIAVRDRYDIPQTLRAGQVWQRAHLLATARGLAARPANGAVEIIDREKRLNQQPRTSALVARIIGEPQWQPTFMFYMGYPTLPAPPSARRSIREVLL
jgi:hypothetical protein